MKRLFIILALTIVILLLPGCSKKEPVANFIPTPTPLPQQLEDEEDLYEEEFLPEDESNDRAKTTKMYVDLSTSGGVLNVRSSPSTAGDVVGFLVHAEEVKVIDVEDGWASIVFQDKVRYISSNYIADEKID